MRPTLVLVAALAAAAAIAAWRLRATAPARPAPAKPVTLVVRLVDAVTGEPVHGGQVQEGEARGGDENVPPTPDGSCFRRETSSLRRSEWTRIAVSTSRVPGYADASEIVDAMIGTFTDVAEVTIAVRPVIDLTVDVRDARGDPVEGANVVAGRAGDLSFGWWPRVDTDTRGQAVVTRVPFVPDVRVRVAVQSGDAWGQGEISLGPLPQSGLVVPVTIGARRPDADLIYSMGGGGPGPGGPRVPVEYGEPRGDATVLVTLLLPDGAGHAGVPLALTGFEQSVGYWRIDGTTDDAGRVAFEGAPAGPCHLRVWGRGISPEERDFVAVAGGTIARTLRESLGRTSWITVVDEKGRPSLGARVRQPCAERGTWGYGENHVCVQEERGVQALAPCTGVDGRARLIGLPAGRISIDVDRGNASARSTFTAGDDITVRLEQR